MKEPRVVNDSVSDPQIRASNPAVSTFVSANAGSGKTHVLVNRVIRLLLQGARPEKILCITFTKAAAANMSQRVFETLGRWINLSDAELNRQLAEAGVKRPDAIQRTRARELFSHALETPGGLKVQTIHALCTRLLQQFPFEANVPARFEVLDDRDQFEIVERAILGVFLEAAANPQSATGKALAAAITSAADRTFRDVVHEACLGSAGFMEWIDGGEAKALAQLHRALGLNGSEQPADVERDIVNGPHLPLKRWLEFAAILDGGSKTDQKQAETLRFAFHLQGGEQVEEYLSIFLTTDKEFRKSVVTQRFVKDHPSVAAAFNNEASRLVDLLEKRRAVAAAERSRALVQIAAAVAKRYVREKQERGLLDYDDLIDKTLAMLRRTASGWVHYKLDQGVDHVLVDEAQDTSPHQWEIVSHIIEDFASGAGARGNLTRTLFAVGDEKQSIFSFQGAAPREFDRWHRDFRRRFEKAGLEWDGDIRLNFSFRSGRTILDAVDQVFRSEEIYPSIHTRAIGPPVHNALADAAPGVVELWDLAHADDGPDIDGWSAPFDHVAETSAEAKLSARITRAIKAMVDTQEAVGRPGNRRPVRPGDILVLVRRRGKLFDAVLQALKRAHVPVAGADRLKLTEHIAIIDLMHLADAILMPWDDLALAVVLKSPLFGLSEEQLFTLAHGRGRKKRLRSSLAEHAAADPAFAPALDRLTRCEAMASHASPFAFYSWLLGPERGRSQILSRLSHEASDALDEFLELALRYEQREPATLQGFTVWLRATDIEIKRDMEISRDEVRVMTAHGAKGLEAPVVFLVDTTSTPLDNARLSLIRFQSDSDSGAAPDCVVWAGRKADDPTAVRVARQRMEGDIEHEYRRLLYVAMTRAAERLIICGVQPGNRKEEPKNSWYRLVANGLEASELVEQPLNVHDGMVRRFTRPDDTFAPVSTPQRPKQAELVLPPYWLHEKAKTIEPAFEFRRPSDAENEGHQFARNESPRDRQRALRRGVLVHRLLQSLPDVPADRRRDAATLYLARNAKDFAENECAALAAQTLGIIDGGRFAELFTHGSRAEVPIVGRIARAGRTPLAVSGQIDRLIVTEREILIADYKTNHAPPRELAGVPSAYRQQLALYRTLLQRLYPQRAVRAALVWTETPEIMEIPAGVLDDEMTKISSS
jgi:ATP-dependent helicase/nuclease subunit A